jgi:perosamine synthetase
MAGGERIPLSRPDLGDDERQAVLEVLDSGRLSLGSRGPAFEDALARRAGVGHGVATSSGTAALHLAVRALGLAPGDDVVTTPFSFVASANCLLFEGVRPVFVDVEPDTLNIDPGKVRDAISDRTRAVLAVDVFGHPADWAALRSLADEFDLRLIEDSAEALGSTYRDRAAGGLGDVGVFGFYPNKQITTGEGGALVTDDEEVARLCASLRNHGREPDRDDWHEHKRLGYNYRLSEIACALGLVQLDRLDAMAADRARVAGWYNERLAGVDALRLPAVRDDVGLSWFVYVVRLAGRYTRDDRDRVIVELRSRGIGCRNYFPPIHLQPFYREHFGCGPGDFPVSEAAAERTIALPFFSGISESEVEEVVACLRELL